jgi:putative membrane protein
MAVVAGMLAAVPASARQTAASGSPRLNDAEIAHVAVTANAVDIEVGRVALGKAESAVVKSFAETMIRDHTGVNEQASALAAKLKVVPQGNAVSASLRDGEKGALRQLAGLKGGAFDRAYMDREVAYHQAVIDAVDGVLLPQTQNAELKALLTAVRPALVAHLTHAKQIRAGLK